MSDPTVTPSLPVEVDFPKTLIEVSIPGTTEEERSGPRIKSALKRFAKMFLNPTDPSGGSFADALAFVAWKRAIAGNLDWAKWISNRTEGMPLQAHEVGGHDGGPISVGLVSFAPGVPAAIVEPIEAEAEVDDPIGDLL